MGRLSQWAQYDHWGPYKKGVKVKDRKQRWDGESRGWMIALKMEARATS